MGLTLYRISELLTAAKAAVRGVITTAATESGTDFALFLDVASQMWQGSQVAAAHVYEQLFPRTMDATNRERLMAKHGIDFTKPATKARGYLLAGSNNTLFEHHIKKGTTFDFAADNFVDGVARSYVAIEDTFFRSAVDGWPSATAVSGQGNAQNKIQLRTVSARVGDVFVRALTTPDSVNFGIIKSVDMTSRLCDLWFPACGDVVDGQSLLQDQKLMLVPVEAVEAGVSGNAAGLSPIDSPTTAVVVSDDQINRAILIEASGGGDEVGAVDGDTARVVRVLEDYEAAPPSNGNAQHWREIALQCPDVDLDDAIVYTGVRGPASIDIVVIGRKGETRNSAFPDCRTGHLPFAQNFRRVGDVQAKLVETWCKSKASYYDDVKVRSVEWDRRGTYPNASGVEFFRSATSLLVAVEPLPGYGPDSGALITYAPYDGSDFTKLYPASSSVRIDERIKIGDRVTVNLRSQHSVTYPRLSIVTTVVGLDFDRRFAMIADLSTMAAMLMPQRESARIESWYTAGPLDQPVQDAIFDYFDELGPGSYTQVPLDPTYQDELGAPVRQVPASRVERWPDESRRWPGGLRKAALAARIQAVKGVKGVTITKLSGSGAVEFDPAPLQTLLPSAVHVVVT
jgi:hypothetical protein